MKCSSHDDRHSLAFETVQARKERLWSQGMAISCGSSLQKRPEVSASVCDLRSITSSQYPTPSLRQSLQRTSSIGDRTDKQLSNLTIKHDPAAIIFSSSSTKPLLPKKFASIRSQSNHKKLPSGDGFKPLVATTADNYMTASVQSVSTSDALMTTDWSNYSHIAQSTNKLSSYDHLKLSLEAKPGNIKKKGTEAEDRNMANVKASNTLIPTLPPNVKDEKALIHNHLYAVPDDALKNTAGSIILHALTITSNLVAGYIGFAHYY